MLALVTMSSNFRATDNDDFWETMSSLFAVLLLVVCGLFALAKVTGSADITWWGVFAPLWVTYGLVFVALIIRYAVMTTWHKINRQIILRRLNTEA